MCVPSFNLLGLTVPEKSVMKNVNVWKLDRKKNEKKNKGYINSTSLIPVYGIHLPIVQVCTKFQSSGSYSSWEKCDETFQCLKIGEKEKWIRGQISSSLIPYTRFICTLSTCVPSFNLLGLTAPEKNFNVWKLERKKNEEIKGRIGSSCPIPVYTIHLSTVHKCT